MCGSTKKTTHWFVQGLEFPLMNVQMFTQKKKKNFATNFTRTSKILSDNHFPHKSSNLICFPSFPNSRKFK